MMNNLPHQFLFIFKIMEFRSYDFKMFLSILCYDNPMEATPCIF